MDNYPDIREKILITGGHGLVGKALQKALRDYKKHFLIHFLSSKECDLTMTHQEIMDVQIEVN